MTSHQARQPKGLPSGGQYASIARKPSDVTLNALSARGPQWFEDRLAGLATLRDQLENFRDNDSYPYYQLDLRHQRASIGLAAAALLRDHPKAKTMVLRENEDGEDQYEILTIRDSEGNDVVDPYYSEWSEELVGGEGSPELASMAWALDVSESSWARGIAETSHSRNYGAAAVVDLHAAAAIIDEELNTTGE